MIRYVEPSDANTICRIYNEYIANSTATFEEDIISPGEMISRILNVTENYPWLVYEHDEEVLGYTYATRWKERSAYREAVEVSIYIARTHTGEGIGTELNEALLKELQYSSVHCVVSGIALPNAASVALYEKFGFEKVAHFKEIGTKFNKRIDIGYWQLLLK